MKRLLSASSRRARLAIASVLLTATTLLSACICGSVDPYHGMHSPWPPYR